MSGHDDRVAALVSQLLDGIAALRKLPLEGVPPAFAAPSGLGRKYGRDD